MSLNQNNIVHMPTIQIDPNAFLPPGLVNVRYADVDERELDGSPDEYGEVVAILYDESINISEPESDPVNFVRPPDTVTIVGQTVHVAADGRFLVDLVLDVEDFPEVNSYNIRLTKGVAP